MAKEIKMTAELPQHMVKHWRPAGAGLLLIRLALGGVLLWASVSKVSDPISFMAQIAQYELVGSKLGGLAAIVLPWLEFLLAICLISNVAVFGSLFITSIMFFTYVVAQGIALHRGLAIDCGCGLSDATGLLNWETILRTSLLFLASGTGCLLAASQGISVHDSPAGNDNSIAKL